MKILAFILLSPLFLLGLIAVLFTFLLDITGIKKLETWKNV